VSDDFFTVVLKLLAELGPSVVRALLSHGASSGAGAPSVSHEERARVRAILGERSASEVEHELDLEAIGVAKTLPAPPPITP
jgi:hypothetical protein